MKSHLILRSALPLVLLLWFAFGCAPAQVEPAAEHPIAQGDAIGAPTEQALKPVATATPDSYPRYGNVWPTATHPPGPYPPPTDTPWPTATFGPSPTPRPTRPPAPTETVPPVPTLPPTPVVTVVPTAAPPFIPFPEGTTAEPFTIYWREGDIIRALRSDEGATPQDFLNPLAEFGHYLPPEPEVIREWGALSPDGQKLALVLTDDPISKIPLNTDAWSPASHPTSLYLFDMATRDLRLLAPDGFLPVWSPDSQRLAYRSTETLGLWVVDVATAEAREVYAVEPAEYGEYPHYAERFAWASDSRHLAVFDDLPYESRELLIVDAEGQAPPLGAGTDLYHPIGAAQWSPVDDRLTYTRTGEGRQPLTDLWIMNGDLTGQTQLTEGLNILGDGPNWSTDGHWIAVSGVASYEAEFATYDVWLVEPDSGALHRLTYDTPAASYEEYHAAGHGNDGALKLLWSPDYTQLIYLRDSSQLWALSLIDGSRRLLLQREDELYKSGVIVGP